MQILLLIGFVFSAKGGEPEFLEGDPNPPFNFIRLNIVGGTSMDETVIYFDEDATDEYDEQFDALKMMSGNPGVPNIMSKIGDGDFSINVLGDFKQDKEIPLTISITQVGSYVISVAEFNSFDPTSMVYLEDKATNKFYNLRLQDKITIQFVNGIYTGRFFLHIDLPINIQEVPESCIMEDGKVRCNNPSSNPWDIRLLSDDGLTLIKEAKNVRGVYEFTGLHGGDYLISLLKPADGFSHNVPVSIAQGIKLDAGFSFSTGVLKNNKPIDFQARQQGLGLNYNWDMGDGTIVTGDSVFEHRYEFPGIYTITLLVSNGECSEAYQDVITILPDVITGGSSLKEKDQEDIVLSPVPASNFLTIKANATLCAKATWMEIKDISGKTLRKELVSGLLSDTEGLTIPIAGLEQGYYFILISGENTLAAKRFLVSY